MSPAEVHQMTDTEIVELLVSLKPADESVAWLASVIADPAKVAGVNELSRRYVAASDGRPALPRAKSAGSVAIDGAKLKELFWRHRIPLVAVGPQIGKCRGLISVLAFKGQMSFWTADAIATEVLDMHVDQFLAQVAAPSELERLASA
jgi:hypothetical protein